MPGHDDVIRPDHLVLFGRVYTLEEMPPLMIKNGYLAAAEYIDATIVMTEGMDQALWLKTLIHEVTHVAQNEVGRESSEDDANWVSVFIHDLLVNNPDIALAYAALGGGIEFSDEGIDDD